MEILNGTRDLTILYIKSWKHATPIQQNLHIAQSFIIQCCAYHDNDTCRIHIEGMLPKGPYLPCVIMAGRALLAGYPRYQSKNSQKAFCTLLFRWAMDCIFGVLWKRYHDLMKSDYVSSPVWNIFNFFIMTICTRGMAADELDTNQYVRLPIIVVLTKIFPHNSKPHLLILSSPNKYITHIDIWAYLSLFAASLLYLVTYGACWVHCLQGWPPGHQQCQRADRGVRVQELAAHHGTCHIDTCRDDRWLPGCTECTLIYVGI